MVTHAAFADITYYVGLSSAASNFQPVFSGAVNANCPQTVTMSLKIDGTGDTAWVTQANPMTISGTSYSFITSVTTSGLISVLGGFTINNSGAAK